MIDPLQGTNPLLQMGVGGVVLLVLDRAIALVKVARNGNGNGTQMKSSGVYYISPEFLLAQLDKNRLATIEAMNAAMKPIEKMSYLLQEIRDNTRDMARDAASGEARSKAMSAGE